jgi:Ca2+-binding EF-hand superfamily protein
MRTTLFVAFSALALASSAAWAKEPSLASDDARTAHAETDENHDGNIDREEFHHRQVDVFYHADTDKDGSLSEAEFAKLDSKTPFTVLDKNADGKLSMNEFTDYRSDQFEDADTNGDGVLSLQEVLDYVGQ